MFKSVRFVFASKTKRKQKIKVIMQTSWTVTILARSSISEHHLMTFKALFIAQLKPSINTRDEFKSHKIVINLL